MQALMAWARSSVLRVIRDPAHNVETIFIVCFFFSHRRIKPFTRIAGRV
jgi:hypothetical protein